MTGLRTLLLALCVALLPALSQAQDSPEAASDGAIAQTIRAQLDAFLRDDGVAAFSHAAPTIQEMFQDPETFMAMVRGGYGPVYRPRDVEFLEPRAEGGDVLQPVRVTGPDGASVIAIYRMRRLEDGTWKIAGVVLQRTGEVGA